MKNQTKKLAVALIAIALSGCGSESGSGGGKSLFSVWAEQGGSGGTLDLSTGKIGSFTMYFDFANGARCSADVTVAGDGVTGSASIRNGTLVSGTDPGCSKLNFVSTYKLENSVLTICTSGKCETYK